MRASSVHKTMTTNQLLQIRNSKTLDFKMYTILNVLIQACMYVYLPDSFTIMIMVNASMMRDGINICYLQKNNEQNNISIVEEDELFLKS